VFCLSWKICKMSVFRAFERYRCVRCCWFSNQNYTADMYEKQLFLNTFWNRSQWVCSKSQVWNEKRNTVNYICPVTDSAFGFCVYVVFEKANAYTWIRYCGYLFSHANPHGQQTRGDGGYCKNTSDHVNMARAKTCGSPIHRITHIIIYWNSIRNNDRYNSNIIE